MEESAVLGPRLEAATSLGEDYAVEPFGLSWRSHTLFIISTVIIGLFSETFLYGIVVPVLPFILQDRLGVIHDELQGYSSALLAVFAVSSAICAPFVGALADRFQSRKTPLMIGLAILIAATILFFAGHSVSALVVARCTQGASSAVVWTVGFALCFDTVGSENMGKTLGTVMSFVNVGTIFSPPLGGILYHQAGVLAVAAVSTGILVVDLIMQTLLIEKKAAARYFASSSASTHKSPDSDHPEAQEEPSRTEGSPLLGHEDASRDYFIAPIENRVLRSAPILVCLRNSSLVVAFLISGIRSALLGAFDATIPLQAIDLFRISSPKAGLLFVPMGCLRLAMGPAGGWAVDRYGSKVVAVFGYSLLTPVLILFRLVKPEPRATEIALYCVLLALCGFGLAMVSTPSFVEAGAVVQKYHRRNPGLFGENGPLASLYGMNLMVFSLGLTLGPLLAGGLRERYVQVQNAASLAAAIAYVLTANRIGYGNMNAVLAGLAAMSAIASFMWLGGRPMVLGNNKT